MPYNIKDFGAKGDGTTDDRMAIQAALDAARTAGGGSVYVPGSANPYLVSTTAHPTAAGLFSALVIGTNTQLFGDGAASQIKLAGNSPNQCYLLVNHNVNNVPLFDADIVLEHLLFNGNAAGQNANMIDAQFGVAFYRSRGLRAYDVTVQSVFGVTSGENGPHGTTGERFHIEFAQSTDAQFVSCTVIGDADSGLTASGFSADQSTNISYEGCVARGMKRGKGFTHSASCSQVRHVNCSSYLNSGTGSAGFNSESSTDIEYVNCQAGGVAAGGSGNYPFAAGASLGNRYHGWILYQPNRVQLTNCMAVNNASDGIHIDGPTGPVRLANCIATANAGAGVSFQANTDTQQTRLSGCYVRGNGAAHPSIFTPRRDYLDVGVIAVDPVPASGTAYTNPTPYDCQVTVIGGSVTAIAVNGTTTGVTSGTVRVPAGGTITITYRRGAPTWLWMSDN